jgi:hypothetical protein
MGTVSLTLPSDGQTIDASDVNNPLNTILNEFNGNIDDNNIKSAANISGTKLLVSSMPANKLDANGQGGWITGILPAVSSVTYNGNGSSDITFASTVANILTPGMRIRTSRTVAAPTQSTSLNGTTQYWSKASPNKLTFTDDFVVSAWIKLSSYAAGVIVGRTDATPANGFYFQINADGTITLIARNAGIGNFSQIQSYQSVPLNKWVHVAAQLDMSSFTATPTTSYIMIDGVDVPATVSRSGTNPTAFVQAGDLIIGARMTPTGFFPGKIAQVAIYNAKVTQATIRASKNQTLSGSETSLASAYSFNNSTADLNTTTPNDLTANGSAVATNADSPFTTDANGTAAGTYDWAIVTKVATTVATVQSPEGSAIPTSGGISTVDYSGVKAPFGMPVQKGRWDIETLIRVDFFQNTATANTWYNLTSTSGTQGGFKINAPIGEWDAGYEVIASPTNSTNGPDQFSTLSTANNSETDSRFTSRVQTTSSNTSATGMHKRENPISLTTATDYFLNSRAVANSTTTLRIFGTTEGASFIRFRNAWL